MPVEQVADSQAPGPCSRGLSVDSVRESRTRIVSTPQLARCATQWVRLRPNIRIRSDAHNRALFSVHRDFLGDRGSLSAVCRLPWPL
ncbi:hypothetical protein GW17_00058766 [Ensete ventricosum]|nr:hypothetical protein GW17_00058766 [Ensete ventricosum]